METDCAMYDFSLKENYKNIKYSVEVFNINVQEHADTVADLMQKNMENKGIKILHRKDMFCERNGTIFVHLEWITYDAEKVSPFEPSVPTGHAIIDELNGTVKY